jgi:hypothetical protein
MLISVSLDISQTFIDNHDTGSTQAHWPFPHDKVSQGYAYILTHPGMPCIFYDHFFEWGDTLRSEISMLLEVRNKGSGASAHVACMDVGMGGITCAGPLCHMCWYSIIMMAVRQHRPDLYCHM